jgi:hypothetical protein
MSDEESYDASLLEFSGSESSFDPTPQYIEDEPTFVMVDLVDLQNISVMLTHSLRVFPSPTIEAMRDKIDVLVAAAKNK